MKISKNQLNNFSKIPKKWRNSILLSLVIGAFVFWGYYFVSQPRNFLLHLNFFIRPPRNFAAGNWPNFQNLFSSLGLFPLKSSIIQQSTEPAQQKSSPFENIKLDAKAAYVFDILKNQPLFELNTEIQLPLASLAKIMTAIAAAENLPAYLLIPIPQEAILQEGDEGFWADEQWPVSDLIEAMLISSSNDAAFSLSSAYEQNFSGNFVSLMNQKAKILNLAQTYFLNSTGFDFSKNYAGAYGSAKDVANLFLYAFKNHPSLMEITRLKEVEINQRKFKNTDRLVNDLPGFIAGKTGFSDLAGGNLAIVADKGYGHPIIIVVLGSTFDGRFEDVKTLYNSIP